MGRPRLPDRAWHRWNKALEQWEIVVVRRGARTCELCPRGTAEKTAERAAKALHAELAKGGLIAPDVWGDADVEDTLVADFLEAAKTGQHRPPSKRGKRKGVRPATLDWYKFRLREAGRVLTEVKGENFDPLTVSLEDGQEFIQLRGFDTAPSGDPISAATINAEIEAVTILQRFCVLRGWLDVATWDELARLDATSSREPLGPDDAKRFLRSAYQLARDPRGATDWLRRKEAKANGTTFKPSERRSENWALWPVAVWLLMHGLRTEEAHHILIRDVDPVRGEVRIVDRTDARTKNRSSARTIPILAAQGLAALAAAIDGRGPDERLFDTGRGKGAVAEGRTKWFWRRTKETCRLAGIRECSVHELRHTVATAAIAAGADLPSVSALLGHAAEKTTRRVYNHARAGVLARPAAVVIGAWLADAVPANEAA